jgi:outer membrane protein TolC
MKMKLIAFIVICVACLCAQAPVEPRPSFFQKLASPWTDKVVPAFPSPAYFKKMVSTPSSRVELLPPVRLADYVQDGKLVLSLKAYLDLVMANNTDVSIQRLTIERSRNNLLGSFSDFDPSITMNLGHQRTQSTDTTTEQGVLLSKNLNQTGDLTFNQLLSTGQTVSGGFSASKIVSNATNVRLNPNLGAGINFGITQQLLRGRALDMVRIKITTARINLRSTVLTNRDSMMTYVQNAESAYWDVLGARDSLRVAEAALALQQISMDRSNKMLELGAMAELDIYQPRAQLEQSRIQVSQAKFSLMGKEDALRRQMGADLDPTVRLLPLELTEAVAPPEDTTVLDREALVQKALTNRPDLDRAVLALQLDDLNVKQSINGLRPSAGLTARYSTKGNDNFGFTNAFSTVFARDNPTYSFALRVTLPLHDRAAAANLANSLLSKKSDTLFVRRTEEQVRLDVLNAVTALESSKEQVKLAIILRDLAKQDQESWQKKFDLGTTEMYFVLDAQNRLANAESSLSSAYITYHRNELNLQRVTGELLERRGIVIE